MKKLFVIIASIFILILLSLIYLSVSSIKILRTDKATYSSGEEVEIHWVNLGFRWCSCINDYEIQLFKEESTGWKRIIYKKNDIVNACIDGKAVNLGYGCDAISCSYTRPFKEGSLSWNLRVYEEKGFVDSCILPYDNKQINGRFRIYDLKDAPAGRYKIKFGKAEKIIEIK